jgi:hypothetical protein
MPPSRNDANRSMSRLAPRYEALERWYDRAQATNVYEPAYMT